MKKILLAILAVMLIILLLLVGLIFYLYFVFQPLMNGFQVDTNFDSGESTDSQATDSNPVDKHPLLTDSQEQMLEKIGIDPAKLPQTITPELEQCFIAKLGQERVDQIKSGQSPTAVDLFKAKSCITN